MTALLTVDGCFIAAHLAAEPAEAPRWRLDHDGGYPELWGYAKLSAAAASALAVAVRWRSRIMAAWGGGLLLMALDDRFRFHERGGELVAERGGLPEVPRLAGSDLGELAVWAVLGVPVLLVLVALHRRTDGRERVASMGLAGLVLCFAGFAVVGDVVHQAAPRQLWRVGTVVEDGGELLVQSLIAAYGVLLLRWR